MTLQKQTINVPIHGGTDEGQHEFVAMSPSNVEVYDCRFLEDGSIAKRFGSVALPTLASITDHINDEGGAHSVAEFGGNVAAVTHDGAFLHDEVRASWKSLGTLGPRPSQAKTDPLIRGTNTARQPDMAVGVIGQTKVACAVWHDPEADVVYFAWYEVPSDGRPLIPLSGPTAISGNLKRVPKVACADGRYFAICGLPASGTGVYYAFCDSQSGYSFSASALVHGNAALSSPCCELFAHGSGASAFFWLVTDDGANVYLYRRKSSTFAADANRTIGKTGAKGAGHVTDGTERVIIAFADGNIHRTLADCSAAGTTSLMLTPTATTQVHCATVCQSDSSGGALVIWSGDGDGGTDAGGAGNYGLDVITLSPAGTGVGQVVVGQVRLGGRACWDGSAAHPLIPLINKQTNPNDTVPFYSGYLARCVLDSSDDIVGLALVASFGIDLATIEAYAGLTRSAGNANQHLPGLVSPNTGEFLMPYQVFVDQTVASDTAEGIDVVRVETVGSAALRDVSAAGLRLWQSGAGVSYTDGVLQEELTPPPPTEVIVQSHDTAHNYGITDPTVAFGASSVFVSFAIRWRDAKGNVHRSLPTEESTKAFSVLDTGVYYPQRWLIPKPWPCAGDYEVEVYQAASTGATMYYLGACTPIASANLAFDYIVPLTANPPLAGGFTEECILILAPAALPGAGLVERWTDLGELQHVPPPPFVDICSTQERLWGLSAEKGRLEVWPSKLITEGYAPEFSPTQAITIPAEGGECTAIEALDDKVIVFKERAIFVIFGDPGNNNGERSTVQPPRLVSGDVGCTNANSVVAGPFGVAFQSSSDLLSSRAGIHALGKDLGLTHVGLPAKTVSAGVTFRDATLVPAEKEVRWVMPDLDLLVWSYDLNRWHQHRSRGALSACLRRGRYVLLATSSAATVDLADFDGTCTFDQQITTSWIKLGGLQGFQRVWLSYALFRWYTGGIRIDVAYDYASAFGTGTLNEFRTWGHSAVDALDVSGGRVQLGVDHVFQKCEAIRFRFTSDCSNNGGRGFELVGLVLEAGLKKGSFRRYQSPSARK